jgi:hypothetical protein
MLVFVLSRMQYRPPISDMYCVIYVFILLYSLISGIQFSYDSFTTDGVISTNGLILIAWTSVIILLFAYEYINIILSNVRYIYQMILFV